MQATRRFCCITAARAATTFSTSSWWARRAIATPWAHASSCAPAGVSQIREIAGGGSYLSQSDLRAHFGLGGSRQADTVEVTWPSGLRQTFRDVEADKFYVIEEGKEQLAAQKFVKKEAKR